MSIETPDPAFQADALHKVNNASFDNGESFASLCAQIYAKVHTFLDSHASSHLLEQVQEQTRLSLRIIDEALARFGPTEISFSYNGGKDCLVLLILYLVSLQSRHKKNGTPLGENLPAVYIVSSYPFEEVENFVATSSQTYHLDLLRYPIPMRQAFDDYIKANTEIKAILVGTRRTDPHGSNLRYFDPTDRGWPSFMRVHPVIDWHYAEIWAFIKTLEIPYCALYDLGYTSIGGLNDTFPNPALKIKHDDDHDHDTTTVAYRPAYELLNDDEERLGRDK